MKLPGFKRRKICSILIKVKNKEEGSIPSSFYFKDHSVYILTITEPPPAVQTRFCCSSMERSS